MGDASGFCFFRTMLNFDMQWTWKTMRPSNSRVPNGKPTRCLVWALQWLALFCRCWLFLLVYIYVYVTMCICVSLSVSPSPFMYSFFCLYISYTQICVREAQCHWFPQVDAHEFRSRISATGYHPELLSSLVFTLRKSHLDSFLAAEMGLGKPLVLIASFGGFHQCGYPKMDGL